MSTSEIEEQPTRGTGISRPFRCKGMYLPGRFSDDDMAFAQELDEPLHYLKKIPPYYVQTLLDCENPVSSQLNRA